MVLLGLGKHNFVGQKDEYFAGWRKMFAIKFFNFQNL